ncbi:hypothetical protein CAPTEDRAFT_204063 [Capitella teleta]|uniref:Uncharacterized protein n=1 Tax=Capitella teleta TaxID=283909 RepID=R7VD59_CAPTE|nr:hypothetical protein CAPTEDRAFT_204063 [Capitella teleta]|eukprot:ELU13620.1 hypothetical protein CAPTEDRAFT_204063 [Capitella teleta]
MAEEDTQKTPSGSCEDLYSDLLGSSNAEDEMVTSFSNPNYGLTDAETPCAEHFPDEEDDENIYADVRDDDGSSTDAVTSNDEEEGVTDDQKKREVSPFAEPPTKGFLGYYASLERSARKSQDKELAERHREMQVQEDEAQKQRATAEEAAKRFGVYLKLYERDWKRLEIL